ncbi:hypothetical protein WDU94_010223 [Cyamophila willieti]
MIGIFISAVVCVQICSTISLTKPRSLVKRNPFGAGAIGNSGLNAVGVESFNVEKLTKDVAQERRDGKENPSVQSHVSVVRRNTKHEISKEESTKIIGNSFLPTKFRRDPNIFNTNGESEGKLEVRDVLSGKAEASLSAGGLTETAKKVVDTVASSGSKLRRRSSGNSKLGVKVDRRDVKDGKLFGEGKLEVRDVLSGKAEASLSAGGLTETAKKVVDTVASSGSKLRRRSSGDIKLGVKVDRRDVKEGKLFGEGKLEVRDVLSGKAEASLSAGGLTETAKKVVDTVASSGSKLRRRSSGDIKLGVKVDRRDVKDGKLFGEGKLEVRDVLSGKAEASLSAGGLTETAKKVVDTVASSGSKLRRRSSGDIKLGVKVDRRDVKDGKLFGEGKLEVRDVLSGKAEASLSAGGLTETAKKVVDTVASSGSKLRRRSSGDIKLGVKVDRRDVKDGKLFGEGKLEVRDVLSGKAEASLSAGGLTETAKKVVDTVASSGSKLRRRSSGDIKLGVKVDRRDVKDGKLFGEGKLEVRDVLSGKAEASLSAGGLTETAKKVVDTVASSGSKVRRSISETDFVPSARFQGKGKTYLPSEMKN